MHLQRQTIFYNSEDISRKKWEEKMPIKQGNLNAGRLFQALGRIGYHPVSALLDLVDNSVSAGATSVIINVGEKSEERIEGQRGRSRAILQSFTIIDNGCGMDEDGLDNALTLGSSSQSYDDHTFSKFGMGLKTASSSLGKRLEIISRVEGDLKVRKVILDHDMIDQQEKYVYDLTEPTEDDLRELDNCVQENSGTLIRISKLHTESLPRATEIIDGLKNKAGVTYYYYLKESENGSTPLSLKIDDFYVEPVDPLFVDEIDPNNPNLNVHTWEGLEPKWITNSRIIQLDKSGSICAKVEITQLPHPQCVAHKEIMTASECREHFKIESRNYGFYIYRNNRLISWAESLDFVPRDQDLYAFRGRLLINSDADDVLNIDVTKSRIHLSEVAEDHLKGEIREAVKMSRNAWQTAYKITVKSRHQIPHDTANQELDRISRLQDSDDKRDESVAPIDERKELEKRRNNTVTYKPITPEESQTIIETGQRVLFVDMLDNNQLWERAHDPIKGIIVRVNKSHRFCRDILDAVDDNSNLIKVIDVIFFSLARGEYDLVYKSEHEENKIEDIMSEYREKVGGNLSNTIYRINNITEFLADF